jgi:hypothetical protein
MCERIFAGRKKITFDEYMAFRNELIESLWHYEFHQFDRDHNDHLSNYDLCQSMYIYYIPFQKIPEYQLHLDKYKELKKGVCDVQQYCAMQYFLRNRSKIIQTVMDKGKIDFEGLREICDEFERESEYCTAKNVHITDAILNAFLQSMDLDGNGVLDIEETVGVLTSRKEIGSRSLKKSK